MAIHERGPIFKLIGAEARKFELERLLEKTENPNPTDSQRKRNRRTEKAIKLGNILYSGSENGVVKFFDERHDRRSN